jgi:hypothetical protein
MEQGGIIEMTTATVIVVDLGAELTLSSIFILNTLSLSYPHSCRWSWMCHWYSLPQYLLYFGDRFLLYTWANLD